MLILLLTGALLFWLSGILPLSYSFPYWILIVTACLVVNLGKEPTRLIQKLSLSLIGILFAFFFGDLILRVFALELFCNRPDTCSLQHSTKWQGAYRFSANHKVTRPSWGDLAGFSCDATLREVRSIEFVTDTYGFRNRAAALTNEVEILVLGDSFAYGSGVTQDLTFSNLLAANLGKTVYNLAVPACPRQEVRNLMLELPRLKLTANPILLWLIFEGNDLLSDEHPNQTIETRARSNLGQLLIPLISYGQRSPIGQLFGAWWRGCSTKEQVLVREFPMHGTVLFYRPYEHSMGLTRKNIKQMVGWQNLQVAFDSMRKLAKAHALKVYVITAPTKAQVYVDADKSSSDLAILIREQALASGFDFLDLKPSLIKAANRPLGEKQNLLWWKDDTHWNDYGHKVIAAILTEQLKRQSFGLNASVGHQTK